MNFGRAKMEFAQIRMEKKTEFRDEYMTFFIPDALVSPLGIDFRGESFFKIRRIFLSPFLALSDFSDFYDFLEFEDSLGNMPKMLKYSRRMEKTKMEFGGE